jgi:hypothetical protein
MLHEFSDAQGETNELQANPHLHIRLAGQVLMRNVNVITLACQHYFVSGYR